MFVLILSLLVVNICTGASVCTPLYQGHNVTVYGLTKRVERGRRARERQRVEGERMGERKLGTLISGGQSRLGKGAF